jgi:hypothetical protein
VIIAMLMSPVHLAVLCLIPVGLGEVDPETGAPISPMLGRKALIALGIASVLWIAFYAAIKIGLLQL